jgi:hypothetical protein
MRSRGKSGRGGGPEDPRVFSNECRGKVCYTSRKIARGILRAMRKNGTVRGRDTMEEYKCSVCHYWHTGNSSQRVPVGGSDGDV